MALCQLSYFRVTFILIIDLNNKIKSKEIKGPKAGVPESILQGFAKSRNVSDKELFKKETDKGEFYFIKPAEKNILVNLLNKKF